MSEILKNKFKNGMIPDEVAFGELIDEATKETDLSGYATKEEIPVVPDISHLATKSEIPDVSSFITLEEIPPTDLSAYAKVSDIPSLAGLISESTAAELYVRKDNLDTILADYAKKSEIPDVSGYITLDEVPKVDLSSYATKNEVPTRVGTKNLYSLSTATYRAGDIGKATLKKDYINGILTDTGGTFYIANSDYFGAGKYKIRIDEVKNSNPDMSNKVSIEFRTLGNTFVKNTGELTSGKTLDIELTNEMINQHGKLEMRILTGGASSTTTLRGIMLVKDADSAGSWSPSALDSGADCKINVPADYPDLQTAVEAAIHKNNKGKVFVNIQSGFKPSSGILLENKEARNVVITSDDNEVIVSSSFSGNFLRAVGSSAPTLATLVNMNDLGNMGYAVEKGSSGTVDYYCGIKNAGDRGFYISENSHLYGRASVSTGSNNRNVWTTRTSTFEGELGDFSANKGGENAVYISRASSANLLQANIKNAFNNGLAVIRSFVNAESVDVSGAPSRGMVIQRGSHVVAEFAQAQNCGVNGISVEHGSWLSARESDTSGAGSDGLILTQGSKGSFYGLISQNCGSHGVRLSWMSEANLTATNLTNNIGDSIRLSEGSQALIKTATVDAGKTTPAQYNTLTADGVLFN